jgi:hypothetical protein
MEGSSSIYRPIAHFQRAQFPKVNSGMLMVLTVQVLPPSLVVISPVTPSPLPKVLM